MMVLRKGKPQFPSTLVVAILGAFVTSQPLLTSRPAQAAQPLEKPFRLGEFVGPFLPMIEVDYTSTPLPLDEQSARTWLALHETMVKILPDKTPLGEVLKYLKKSPNTGSIKLNILLDPIDLIEAEAKLNTPIPAPTPTDAAGLISIHDYLEHVSSKLWSSFFVHDNIINIYNRGCDQPNPLDVTAAEARTWILLHQRISLAFPDPTPLDKVVQQIQRASVTRDKTARDYRLF